MKLRKKFGRTLLSLAAAASLFAPSFASQAAMPRKGDPKRPSLRKYVEGEVLVQIRNTVSATAATGMLAKHGVTRMRTLANPRVRMNRLRIEDGMAVADKIAELSQDPDVEFVQPNYIYRALVAANDPQYPQLWGMKNNGQKITAGRYLTSNPGTAGKDLGIEAAWDLITDCGTNIVAVIDTGINYGHEDLKANLWDGGATYPKHGYNFVDNNNDPLDLNGHGTHVAATIGAAGNNGLGTTGVCWKTKIMALRALDATGSGTTADLIEAVGFAVTQGAKVINMSLGQNARDASMEKALKAASDAGLVIVTAAGNDGTNNDVAGGATYPCNFNFQNLVCVAALDQSFKLANFSNYGATSVDVGAPGTNILSGFAGTESAITDGFHTGTGTTLNWTNTGGAWAYGTRMLSNGGVTMAFDMLLNPSNWDLATKTYANNLDAKAYKTFNLAGFSAAQLTFSAFVDVDSTDSIGIATKPSAGDPFAGGTVHDQFFGSTDSSTAYFSYDLASCRVASCSVGFRFRSDAAGTDYGIAILDFEIVGLTLNTNSYQTLNGTSMAAPHVAGLAAMLFAYHPKYTAADVVAAIKQGGVATTALAGKTTTGKSANAQGSLRYIAPTTGIKATAL
jgi:subtilisin family serine protease